MQVAVIGAGMVGVSCALALQSKGLQVSLIDRLPPGSETSHGNAGVLSTGSLIPFNHPALWRQLPALLGGRSAGFRYSPGYLARQWGWAARFLANARPGVFARTVPALHALITQSRRLHQDWLAQAGASERLRQDGWLYLYRSLEAWRAAAWARQICAEHGVAFENCEPADLQALEPALKPVFAKGVWFKDSASVDDPGQVVRAYARLFVERGGRLLQAELARVQREAGGAWSLLGPDASLGRFDQLVLALGPFSKAFLEAQALMRLPMAFERGSHLHFTPGPVALRRPVYDTAGGYVLSPMARGWRLSTGVELNEMHAPVPQAQLERAQAHARQALQMGPALDVQPWLGSRPTLSDSRPMIGPCPGQPGLWLALGHQHIGFSTGPASGELLASLMTGAVPFMDPAPFAPDRFG